MLLLQLRPPYPLLSLPLSPRLLSCSPCFVCSVPPFSPHSCPASGRRKRSMRKICIGGERLLRYWSRWRRCARMSLPSVVEWFRRSPFTLPALIGDGFIPGAEAQLSVAFMALRLLQADATSFRHLWDWSPFLSLLTSTSNLTRWLAAQSVAILLQMNAGRQASFCQADAFIPSSRHTSHLNVIYHQYRTSITVEQSLVWVESTEKRSRAPASDGCCRIQRSISPQIPTATIN